MLLNTLATECQLYVDVTEFAKSIRVVDQITVVCSATLPTAMAVTYSVSLMHVGRNADALEVIHSLGILEDYTPSRAHHHYCIVRLPPPRRRARVPPASPGALQRTVDCTLQHTPLMHRQMHSPTGSASSWRTAVIT